jgi:23S rRNA U2552 (ribose-2'-O)-methylase RlmE/FtsJ
MNVFLIPKITTHIKCDDIGIDKTDKTDNNIFISETLHCYLTTIKNQIDGYVENWDTYKKYTNTYEYIHTLVPEKKTSVSRLKPLSRSYYKFIEICKIFDILPEREDKISSFHLAEGPGGFIEATIHLHPNPEDRYIGMTLQSGNVDIPGWKKSSDFLKRNPNVSLENGPKNNGDLFELENLHYCYKNYREHFDIITGDGGFDFSVDFDNQEEQSGRLIFAQILYALSMQKPGGAFIIKFFDTFTRLSIDMLYILSSYYESVSIIKPNTSRMANSEKYVVCQGYLTHDYRVIEKFIEKYKDIVDNNTVDVVSRILNLDIPYYFINKIEDYNAILGQQQIENINATINKIVIRGDSHDDNIRDLIQNNISKCVNWCNRHDIPVASQFL